VFSAFLANCVWVFATVEWAFFLLDLRFTLFVFICLQQYYHLGVVLYNGHHVWGVFPLPGLWGELINCTYDVLPLAGGDVTLVPSLVTLRFFFLRSSSTEYHSFVFSWAFYPRASVLSLTLTCLVAAFIIRHLRWALPSILFLTCQWICMKVEAVRAGLVPA